MSCDIDFEVLMAYLDGDLGPIERGRIAEHIVGCEACRNTVNDLRAVSGALTKWVVPEPAGLPTARELLDRAGAARPAEIVRPVWRGVVLRWAAAAALAVVAVTIAAVVLNRSYERTTETASDTTTSEAPPKAPSAGETKGGGPGVTAVSPPSASNAPNGNTATTTAEPTAKEAPAPNEAVDKTPTTQEAEKKDASNEVGAAAGDEAPIVVPAPTVEQAPKPQAAAPPPPPAAIGGAGGEYVRPDDRRAESGPGSDAASKAGRARKQADLSIKRDDLTIETHDVDSAVSAVESAARAAGGSLASRGSGARRDGTRSVTLIVTVPVEQYEALVGKIKNVGTVKGEMRSSRDVGEALDQLEDREDADRQRAKMVDQTKTATIHITLREP